MKRAPTPAEFAAAIEDALAAAPLYFPPTDTSPDLRPLFFKLSCLSETIVESGLADLGQRDLLRLAAERCRMLANESGRRSHADTLATCSEIIGYLSSVEGCRLPVALPPAVAAFGEQLRWNVLSLASRAAFAQSTARFDRHSDLATAS